jgi:hypothetical protein
MQVVKEEDRPCVCGAYEVLPSFDEGMVQQGASRAQEIASILPVNG